MHVNEKQEKKIEKQFCMQDPYNKENTVEGTIYRHNSEYGNIRIEKVNGIPCPQYIRCTPKFYYPGGVSSPRSYQRGKFPGFKKINIYDKIDGTNILMFRYKNADGKDFISYKTRLVPFLQKAGFKDWIAMWNKMIERYGDEIKKLESDRRYHFSFELYGALNIILIPYTVPLETCLIFAIDPATGAVIDPETFGFKTSNLIETIDDKTNPDERYKQLEDDLEKKFNETRSVEGVVMYVHKDDGTNIAWKCKPPSVLSAQAEENAKFIGFDDVYTTAMNAMESCGSIDGLEKETYELLAESYEEIFIEFSKETIDKAIAKAKADVLFQKQVMDKFNELKLSWKGVDDRSAVATIMRAMMQHFDKKKSAQVFTVIKNYHDVFK